MTAAWPMGRAPGPGASAASAARRVLGGVLLAVAGCLVGVLVAEVMLRWSHVWIGRHSDTLFTVLDYDQTLGWKMKPTIETTVDLVDVEGIPVRSNSAGFWDREFSTAKPADRCRIAFLGDSFTWGMGVREAERFSVLVAATDSRWESLNFGVPGYGADQSLLLWQHVARPYRPDLVVLTLYQNDYRDNTCVVRYGRQKPYFVIERGGLALRNQPVDPATFWDDGVFNQVAPPYAAGFPVPVERRSRLAHWLVKRSDVVRLLYTVVRARREDPRVDDAGTGAPQAASAGLRRAPRPELGPAERAQADLMQAIVRALATGVAADAGRLLVVLAGEPVPQFAWQVPALEAAGIDVLDATTAAIASRLPPAGTAVYYAYSGHWTPAAHRVVAEMVSERIHARRLCAPSETGR